MPVNADIRYQKAESDYQKAETSEEKLATLRVMLSFAPTHKGAEVLRAQIKQRIAKLKLQLEKEKKQKSSGFSFSIKREGAAQVVLVGPTNSGKSTLLRSLTGAHVKISPYPFTTKKPEVGMMDYHGVKIQVIEIPAVVPQFAGTSLGPTFLGIIRHADLLILLFNTPEEKKLLDQELSEISKPRLIYNEQSDFPDRLWRRLGLIKVYTKQPGKKPEKLPIALPLRSTVRSVAQKVHKDFLQHFRFARIFGASVRFPGAQVGLDHILADDDVVEFHLS